MASEPGSEEADSFWAPLLTADPGLKIRFTSLYRHYEGWARDSKYNPVGKDSFRTSLKNHGFKVTKPQNVETVAGLGHRRGHAAQCGVCDERISR